MYCQQSKFDAWADKDLPPFKWRNVWAVVSGSSTESHGMCNSSVDFIQNQTCGTIRSWTEESVLPDMKYLSYQNKTQTSRPSNQIYDMIENLKILQNVYMIQEYHKICH